MKLNDSVEKIKNIGPARSKQLRMLHIYTAGDLIAHFPREYEDRSQITNISQITEGETVTICVKVHDSPRSVRLKTMDITRLTVKDSTASIDIIWFNQGFLKHIFKPMTAYYFTGKAEKYKGRLTIISPDYEKKADVLLNSARIVPIYPLTHKITQKILRSFIKEAIEQCEEEMEEILPDELIEKYDLISKKEAVRNIHFPKSNEMFFMARKRLVFEELFILQISLIAIKSKVKKEKTTVKINDTDISAVRLPFALTKAQKSVIEEITADFKSGHGMYRLIQGDVGSGKTAVAMLACFMAIKSGYQAVLMAPTEVLASQHYLSVKEYFDRLAIETVFLAGSLKKREKEYANERIRQGKAQMIIGTHALIQEQVEYHNLGLVITDEQHRFGVKQRAELSKKGSVPHVLVMSATPIPRTLALVVYGDLDVSVIDELPPGRQYIDTYAVDSLYRERVYKFIEQEILKGRQAYIVCPMVSESEKLDLKNVIDYTEEIRNVYLKGYKIEYLHGKMKPSEKQYIMDMFSKGEIAVLVSTTVIEVGVNVPNATIMLIENAERFGLSQLHQLRGRVGRGKDKSHCIMISDTKSKITAERMKAMSNTNDGFELSELDLKLRGPGDFFGIRQHGLPELKIADIYKDKDILVIAREGAKWAFDNLNSHEPLRRKMQGFLNIQVEI